MVVWLPRRVFRLLYVWDDEYLYRMSFNGWIGILYVDMYSEAIELMIDS